MAKRMSKKLRKRLAHSHHHKGRAGRSRHPFYYTDVATVQELRMEFSVYNQKEA